MITIVPQETIKPILSGLTPVVNTYQGMIVVSDVAVSWFEHDAGLS